MTRTGVGERRQVEVTRPFSTATSPPVTKWSDLSVRAVNPDCYLAFEAHRPSRKTQATYWGAGIFVLGSELRCFRFHVIMRALIGAIDRLTVTTGAK